MADVKRGRVLFDGAVAGLLMLSIGFAARALLRNASFGTLLVLPDSTEITIRWALLDLMTGILIVWTYACLHIGYRAGLGVALITSFAVMLFIHPLRLEMMDWQSATLARIVRLTIGAFAGSLVGGLAGCWLYNLEERLSKT